MTFSEAFKMQEQTMAVWKTVLLPEAYNQLVKIQQAQNSRPHASPFDVWRGTDIIQAVGQVAYETAASTNNPDTGLEGAL